MENTIKVSFAAVSKSVVGKSITGLALFLALFYGFGSNPADRVAEYLSQTAGKFGSTIIKFYYPSFTPDMKVQDLFQNTALESAREMIDGFDVLPEEVRNTALDRAVTDSIKKTEDTYGITIDTEKTVVSQLEGIIHTKVFEFLKQIDPSYLSIGLAVLVFLTITAISPVFAFVVSILGTAVFEMLLILKFIKRKYEPRDKEIIGL